MNERKILYQGLNWHIGEDGLYINNTEKEPILNHLYEVALAYKSKSERLKEKEQECEKLKEIINKSAKNFCNDYLDVFEENEKLKDDLQNIQHNCTREGCKYYLDNTYKVFYKCKAKTELSKYKQALDEIERFFDKRCDICREQNGIEASCDCCWKKDIKDIINKAKGNIND